MKAKYLTPDGQQAHTTSARDDAYPFQFYGPTGDRAEDFMDFEGNPPTECHYCARPAAGPYWFIETLGTFMCSDCMGARIEKGTGQ